MPAGRRGRVVAISHPVNKAGQLNIEQWKNSRRRRPRASEVASGKAGSTPGGLARLPGNYQRPAAGV